MKEYRITKYNPVFRDSHGAYAKEDWIMVGQIGESFSGVTLTRGEYDRVERAYVSAAFAFLQEAGISSLTVEGLENRRGHRLGFGEGSVLPLEQVVEVIGRVLREEFWCRFEAVEGFVHIGCDYYMYVGVPHACPTAETRAIELGLFVEDFISPYKNED